MPEISCSLQKDGYTQPMLPYGYVLKIDKGGINSIFNIDVTSEYDINARKKIKDNVRQKRFKKYNVSDLDELIKNTPKNYLI